MSCKALGNWWKDFFGKASPSGSQSPGHLSLAPLSVGLRVDISLPAPSGRVTNTTRLVWISPPVSDPAVKTLRVLLSPN